MAKTTDTKPKAESGSNSKKTECPITREQFKKAKSLNITVNGMTMLATPREFKTGSFGWNLAGKTVVDVDGVEVQIQVTGNFTVIGSKEVL